MDIDLEIKRLKKLKTLINMKKKADKIADNDEIFIWQKSLSEHREKLGYTLEDVGIAINVRKQTIFKWEKGLERIPHKRAKQLSEIYNIQLPEMRTPTPPFSA